MLWFKHPDAVTPNLALFSYLLLPRRFPLPRQLAHIARYRLQRIHHANVGKATGAVSLPVGG